MRLPKSNFKCQNYRIVIILLPVQLRDAMLIVGRSDDQKIEQKNEVTEK